MGGACLAGARPRRLLQALREHRLAWIRVSCPSMTTAQARVLKHHQCVEVYYIRKMPPDFDHLSDRNVRLGRQLVVPPVPRTRRVGVRKVMAVQKRRL